MASFLENLFKSGGSRSVGGARKKLSLKAKKCREQGFKQCVGSKRQVWYGTARETPGGVRKSALSKKKDGRIVFSSKSKSAKASNNLQLGVKIFPKKGVFGALDRNGRKVTKKVSQRRRSRRSRRSRR